MDVGSDIIGTFKTNTQGLFNYSTVNMTKYCTGGYYLLLERSSTVPGDRLLISIGYKYYAQKVLSFIYA